ncbi:MAG: 50S ribosomal protein L6 [Nitrospirae bacterium RBG_13_41_22]|nr:MAG: 50S ribosomal protein L6 [Nitrospirae bacterium RBG_13_41_22]
MSRIGKKPIEIPHNISAEIKAGRVKVKGPKGELGWNYPDRIKVSVNGGIILVERLGDSKAERALHGLTRSIISNMVTGVSQGYQKVLEIVGVGYKAQLLGNKLVFSLGYSHPIEIQLPEGIKVSVDAKQTQLTLVGIDKEQLGQVAASLKALRLPDAYKGKGIRYSGEKIKLKVGKAGKK